jgi:hypothetical protein
MLWEALRKEKPPGYRDCAIRVVRTKGARSDWNAEIVTRHQVPGDQLERVFAKAKQELQQQYGYLDD